MYTPVALVSGQPRNAKKLKVSVTGAHGRLRELFSSWPLGRGDGKGLDGRLLDLAQLQINIENVKKTNKQKNRKNFVIVWLHCCSDVVVIQAQA